MRIGVDVGGTAVKAGLVGETGEILLKKKLPIEGLGKSGKAFCEDIVSLCFDLVREGGFERSEVSSVGIGFPTAVSDRADMVPPLTNVALEQLPIREVFAHRWHGPLVIGNDAVCAAWAEYLFGSGKGCNNFITVTLGTGIGGGIIISGQPYLGGNGVAGEVGHMVIAADGEPCNCGRHGCWEQYASATALIRMACKEMDRTSNSMLWKLCNGDKQNMNAAMPFLAEREGDAAARKVCAFYRNMLAAGLLNLTNILQPDRIALGGGVSHEREDSLLYPVRELLRGRSLAARGMVREAELVTAQLGNDAGIIGAAFLKK